MQVEVNDYKQQYEHMQFKEDLKPTKEINQDSEQPFHTNKNNFNSQPNGMNLNMN